MFTLSNGRFQLRFTERGALRSLILEEDPYRMNWVIDPEYLREAGYEEETEKLFGEWEMSVDGQNICSKELQPQIVFDEQSAEIIYKAYPAVLRLRYELKANSLTWKVECSNDSDKRIQVNGLHFWFSLAYIMFRDPDVLRNMRHSCAVFPHLGGDFAKFAAIRRSNEAPHLAVFATGGSPAAVGTYCRYWNRFLEQVSPSLDGMLFHRLSFIEDGGTMRESAAADWIYGNAYETLALEPGEHAAWSFAFEPCVDRESFYWQAASYGHPKWQYTPVLTAGGRFQAELELPPGTGIDRVSLLSASGEDNIYEEEIPYSEIHSGGNLRYRFDLARDVPGEHKLVLRLKDGRSDSLVWNVLERIDRLLEERARWLIQHSYGGGQGTDRPYAFRPLSNQGESLGKLTFLLMKNSLTHPDPEQVASVETSAVLDMKTHWFEDGDFRRPKAVYGAFYRIFDLDYIAHVYYLLSRMDAGLLKHHSPRTYLAWAAEVLCLRFDPDCHTGQREKDETRLNGVFIFYIKELLEDLQHHGLVEWHDRLSALWNQFGEELEQTARGYQGAVTEHFYDNAGFGPTCVALLLQDKTREAAKYGQLILANIGFSNDYRAQNPDRWWEALSYMIHSLWGGLVSSSALIAYEHLGDPEYLEAAYRSGMAVFNGYDWNVRSTPRKLLPGEAASTYGVYAPNLNMPVLSHNRFGQSVFAASDDPLFSALFSGVSGEDWDMGEELTAYLKGFGTTAYLYTDQAGELRCVNGFLKRDSEGITVTSYAAYPVRFVMKEHGWIYTAPEGEMMRQVRLTDDGFIPCSLAGEEGDVTVLS